MLIGIINPTIHVGLFPLLNFSLAQHPYLHPQATREIHPRRSMCTFWQNKVNHQKSFSAKLWVVNCLRENRWFRKGRLSMEDGIIVPNSSSNPRIRNILYVLCHVTSLSTGGREVQFPPHCYWVWLVENEDIWQFSALRRPGVFLLVLLAAGLKAGGESRALEWTWSPLEVCSQVELIHILDGPRNSADLGARKAILVVARQCWRDIRYVSFLQQ